uniref:Uncharacterized protein n=1 Tax=Chromera velia CCMP2878 TaxID=1169474 RepID=A0A0G4I415_9ALVE|eukprot:Cvel_10799.t1-p1 / transcript=Cvel_10799.t1 / gene=Cvel_10799 / organism=Chromera_velia_CCMP2878 / gene_product=hypothetical protein / transcript_product=hypothetical protein / location=Cvel_scaffold660:52406-67913(+) / protein_length=1382 / sequence_SO=supercontig / SO=protein_coding / is_pseudo=false
MLEILMTRHHSRPHSAGALGQREGEGDGEGSFLFPSQGSDKTQNGNSAEIQQEQPALSQQSEDEPGAEGMTKEARERETKYERKTGEGETDREKQGDNKRSADDEESQPSHNEDQESKERKEGWMSPGLANLSRPIDPLWPFNASSLLLRPLGLLSSVLGGGSRASEGPPEAPLGSSGIENMFRPDGDVLPRGNEMNRRKGERPGGEVGPSTSFVSSGSASEGGDEDVMPSSFLEMHSAVEQAEETRLTVVPRPVEAVGQIDSPTFPHRQLPLGSFRDHSPASALEAAEDPLDEEGPGMPSQGAGAGGDTPMTDPQDFPNPSEGSAEPASGSPDLMGEGGGDTAPPPLDEGLSQQGGTASAFTEKATDVNARDAMKNTALMLAARENKCKVVDVLLSGGGAVKEGDFQETVDPNLRDAKGRTALMLNIIEGHGQCVEEFLKDRPEVPVEKRVNINEWDNEGLSAMSHAVETNNLGVLKQLLSSKSVSLFNRDTSAEEGESVMSAESSSSFRLPETVLHTAVRHFSEEALEVLLEWIEKKGGTEPEKAEKILNSRNQGDLLKVNKEFHGQTPLLQAIVTRNDHIAEDLLRDERVDVSLPGPDGTTALTSVINRQSLPLLELMVKNPSFKKHPPLSHPMFVTEGPESPLVQLFEKDSFGKNESAIISVLQLEDYSRLSQESEDSQSFMEKFAHKLPSAPEDTWGTSLESSHLVGGRGQGGWRSGGGGSRYMSLQQQREEMKRKGTEMNRDRLCLVRSRERRTVLWFAGRFNHLSVVETLLSMMKQMRSRNCRVHESDVNGETPLAAALTHLAPLSAMPLIRLLFNAVDSETEDTPLTAAMQSDAAKRLVPLFLEKFSTPPLSETPELLKLEEKNKKGETPACLAVELGLTEEAEILVKKAKSLEAYNVIADALYCAAKKGDDALMHKCVATHEQSLDTVLTDRIQYTHQIDHKEVENTEDIQAALALIPHVPPRSKCDTDGGTQHGGDERSTFDVTTWSPFGGGEEDGSAKVKDALQVIAGIPDPPMKVERYWHIGIPCGLMIVMSLGRSMQSYFLSESEARAVAEDFLREGTNPKDFWPPSENEEFNFDISEDEESDEDLVKYEDELMKAAVISPRNYYTITGVSGLCAFLMAMSCVFQRWVMRNYLEFYKFEKSFHSLDGTVKFWTAVGVEVMLVLCLWFITFDVLKPFTLAWATLQNRTARCRCFLTHFPLDKLASSDQDLALRYVEKWGEKRGALLDLFRKRWSSVSAAFNVLLGVLLSESDSQPAGGGGKERKREASILLANFPITHLSMHRHWDELLSLRTNKKTMTTDAKLSIDRIVATYMRRDPLVEIFGVRVQVTFALFVALVILLFLGYILDLHEPEGYLNMKFKRQFGLDTMS